MIEVKSADSQKHPPLDVDEIVGGQRPRTAPTGPPPAPTVSAAALQPEPVAATNPTLPVMPAEPPTAQIPTQTFATYGQQGSASPSAQVAPTAPPRPAAGPQLDWAAVVGELQAMAEDALGNRARKVKDILGAAEPSLSGIEAAIDQIPSISLLFVDSSRLESLAQEMRARLKSHL
jgi:hypothetical protein